MVLASRGGNSGAALRCCCGTGAPRWWRLPNRCRWRRSGSQQLRQMAATVPGKEAAAEAGSAELDAREKGILKADTAAQAQAQLLERDPALATANGIDARGAEELRSRPLGADYGEVSVTVTFTCGIEQLVNFLAALGERAADPVDQRDSRQRRQRQEEERAGAAGPLRSGAEETGAGEEGRAAVLKRKLLLLNIVLAGVRCVRRSGCSGRHGLAARRAKPRPTETADGARAARFTPVPPAGRDGRVRGYRAEDAVRQIAKPDRGRRSVAPPPPRPPCPPCRCITA